MLTELKKSVRSKHNLRIGLRKSLDIDQLQTKRAAPTLWLAQPIILLVTSYQPVKSDALDAPNETPGLYVRNDSDIANAQKDIEKIKSAAKEVL